MGTYWGQQQSPQYLPGRKGDTMINKAGWVKKGVHEGRESALLLSSLLWKHSGVRKRLARILTLLLLGAGGRVSGAYLRSCLYVIWPRHSSALISALAHKPNRWMAQIQSARGTSVLRVPSYLIIVSNLKLFNYFLRKSFYFGYGAACLETK